MTMIAGNAEKNLEFYMGLLGQRLVKQTFRLGSDLKLPPWLEASRSRIEERPPRVTIPKDGGVPT